MRRRIKRLEAAHTKMRAMAHKRYQTPEEREAIYAGVIAKAIRYSGSRSTAPATAPGDPATAAHRHALLRSIERHG